MLTPIVMELTLDLLFTKFKQISVALHIKTSLTMGNDIGYPTQCKGLLNKNSLTAEQLRDDYRFYHSFSNKIKKYFNVKEDTVAVAFNSKFHSNNEEKFHTLTGVIRILIK